MKARQVLAFIVGAFLLLGAAWVVFPAEGVRVGGKHLRKTLPATAVQQRMGR